MTALRKEPKVVVPATQPAPPATQVPAKPQVVRISFTKADSISLVTSLLGMLLNPPEVWDAGVNVPVSRVQMIVPPEVK